jgi:hypothetical protein
MLKNGLKATQMKKAESNIEHRTPTRIRSEATARQDAE